MIEAMGKKGRGFVKVTHPDPMETEIEGEWVVSVEVGEERI